ncbi:hypothetical protein EDC32_101976 [Laceyella sacchari]|nr:hypothetical protein EDC32_101976 [Laceyella sacchari]
MRSLLPVMGLKSYIDSHSLTSVPIISIFSYSFEYYRPRSKKPIPQYLRLF